MQTLHQLNQPKKMYRIITFLKALFWHVSSGCPKSPKSLIDQRYDICKQCEYLDVENSQCLHCGCNINNKKIFMNKLAWADQKCPIDKW
jgi:hypothetical protein